MTDVNTKVPYYKEELKGLVEQLSGIIPEEQFEVFNQDANSLSKTYTNILQLKKGDTAPNFKLPNALGSEVSLSEVLQKKKVVLTFYRGTWCPYCNLALNSYQKILPKIQELGAEMIAISPQTPDHSLSIKEKNELAFEVLSDVGNKVARHFTTVFRNGEAPIQAMCQLGINFSDFYEDDSAEIPIPAVFIIGQDRTVLFAESVSGDYRERIEPQFILDALK